MSRVSRHPAVGLFGGTFDPVHQGHLDMARHVQERCRLDQVLFIPAPQPPHKGKPAVAFVHRVAMLKAALASVGERMQCCCIEADLPSPSYTIHTVEALAANRPACVYSFIIGGDSLLDLPHWYRVTDLLNTVNLIAVRRQGLVPTEISPILQALDPSFHADAGPRLWRNQRGRTVTYLDDLELPVSSSQIRDQLARGEIPDMLPTPVFEYIRSHHLYNWPR